MTSSFRALLVVALTRSSWAFESLSDFSVRTASGDEVSLAQYQAPVTLIVNTASKCGFTGQYKGLEELAQKYGASLQVLAFPCNQFFGQEPGSDAEVQAFVKSTYGVTFPVRMLGARRRGAMAPNKFQCAHRPACRSLQRSK